MRAFERLAFVIWVVALFATPFFLLREPDAHADLRYAHAGEALAICTPPAHSITPASSQPTTPKVPMTLPRVALTSEYSWRIEFARRDKPRGKGPEHDPHSDQFARAYMSPPPRQGAKR